jgi:putative ABC transport system permease protein
VTPRAPLPLALALRTRTGRQLVLGALTAAALASSVGLAVSLELASRSVQDSLTRTAESLAGRAQLSVTAGDAGVGERWLGIVATVEGVRAARPLLQTEFRASRGVGAGALFHAIGIDFLADRPVHDWELGRGALDVDDPLRLLARPESVVLSEALRRRLGVELGDTLPVHADGRAIELVVRGVLAERGIARAHGGEIAAMDVWSMQTVLGRAGFVDRIDVELEPHADVEGTRRAIAERVEGHADVDLAGTASPSISRAIGTLRVGIVAIAGIGAIVALVLAYGSLSLAVERRSAELALLRVAGLAPRQIGAVVALDALAIGAMATLLGCPLGLLLARGVTGAFSRMLAHFGQVEAAPAPLRPVTLAVAVGVGLGASLAGSWLPARRAMRLRPLDALGSFIAPPPVRGRATGLAILLAGSTLAGALIAPGSARIRAAVAIVAGLALVGAAVRRALDPLLEAVSRAGARAPGTAFLLGSGLRARPAGSAVAVTAVAGLVGGVGAIAIGSASIVGSIDRWMGAHAGSVISVRTSDPFQLSAEGIRPEAIEIVRGVEGVADVMENTGIGVRYRGEEIGLLARQAEASARHLGFTDCDGDPLELARAVAAGAAIVSDVFARRFGVGTGQRIELPSPDGPVALRVAGTMKSYDPAPWVMIDRASFARHWRVPPTYRLTVWPRGDTDRLAREIVRATAHVQPLHTLHGEPARRWATTVSSRFVPLLDSITALVTLVGGLAVANLLLGCAVERRRELALLHAAGVSRRQLARLLLGDGLLIGALGSACGLLLAAAWAVPLIEVVEQSYDWSLEREAPPLRLALQAAAAIATATLAAVPACALIRRSTAASALAED